MSSCYLVSQYAIPTTNNLYLDEELVAQILNGYLSLWHPNAIAKSIKAPKIISYQDTHEIDDQSLVCLVDLSNNESHGITNKKTFSACSEKMGTIQNLSDLLKTLHNETIETQAPELDYFFAVGFAYQMVNSLFEAMQHENLLSHESIWEECVQAASKYLQGDWEGAKENLRSACALIQSGREVLHSSSIHLLDFAPIKNLAALLIPNIENGNPVNIIASAKELSELPPLELEQIKDWFNSEQVEICGGLFNDNPEMVGPLTSRIWNLKKGRETLLNLVGKEVKIFAKTTQGLSADTPRVLHLAGFSKALLMPHGENDIPTFRGPVFSWSSSIGRQIETFCREPFSSSTNHTFFHLAFHLGKLLQQDSSPTLAFFKTTSNSSIFYNYLLKANSLAPIFGNWLTMSNYLHEVYPSEYPGPISQDDFKTETLQLHPNAPISGQINHLKNRRTLDCASNIASILNVLGSNQPEALRQFVNDWTETETQTEQNPLIINQAPSELFQRAGALLAERILQRGEDGKNGILLLNPCSFTRRIGMETDSTSGPQAAKGVLAANQSMDKSESIIEVPGLGYTWVPLADPANPPKFSNKFKLADENSVRNEFFEAEIDRISGGLKAFRDLKTRANRLSQQLVANLGSTMKADTIRVSSTGPLFGEIQSEGTITGTNQEVIAKFKQTIRAWLGRPMLELNIEINPTEPLRGDRWSNYIASRFAWPHDQVTMHRGHEGRVASTHNLRTESCDFIEWKWGPRKTFLFTKGLSYFEKQGDSKIDTLLITEGENQTHFSMGLSMDRDHPFQMAMALDSPIYIQKVSKGAPPAGPTGWFFHIDAPNLVLHQISFKADESSAYLLLEETEGFATPCDIRCVKTPKRACFLDLQNNDQGDLSIRDDSVTIYPESNGLMLLKIDF
ncbi:MAG: hypothetical protein NTV50_12190 [Planctomycetota bacterium]|nr:hypothetical protein [Planctomycetota bacterium]